MLVKLVKGSLPSARLVEGQRVRVATLKTLTRKISGHQGLLRQPVVGDIGEVVDATTPLTDAPAGQMVAVECQVEGRVVWRALFEAVELDLASDPEVGEGIHG